MRECLGDDRTAEGGRRAPEEIEVRARQLAVTRHIGDDEVFESRPREAQSRFFERQRGAVHPAAGPHGPVAKVERNRDARAEARDPAPEQIRFLDRRRSQDPDRDAGGEGGFQILGLPQPSAGTAATRQIRATSDR